MKFSCEKISSEKFKSRIGRFYANHVECLPYINWFNPLITLYLNFRSFPLRQAWRLPVFVYGWPRLYSLFGSMECVGKCKPGVVVLNKTIDGMPNNPGTDTAINNWGKIIFHGKCQIYTANKINVSKDGVLDLGADSKISHMCNITAHISVYIGNHVRIAHRSQILDSNFHFIADFNKGVVKRYNKPIRIGDYCWICNSSTITAGAIIPNKTIVASNSLVNKDMSDIPEESIIGGQPAKLIATGFRRVENGKLEKEIHHFFLDNPDVNVFILPQDVSHSICDVDYV